MAEVHGARFYTRSVLPTAKDVLDSGYQSAHVMPQRYEPPPPMVGAARALRRVWRRRTHAWLAEDRVAHRARGDGPMDGFGPGRSGADRRGSRRIRSGAARRGGRGKQPGVDRENQK